MENFRLARYRFHIQAGERGLDLPPFKGSALRGVMGRVMRQMSCADPDWQCLDCRLRPQCPYAYVFETAPSPVAAMMKGYDQVPRPYVIEPPPGGQEVLPAGEEMAFDLLLFGRAIPLFPYFLAAFREGGRIGLGSGKKKYKLVRVEAVNDFTGAGEGIFQSGGKLCSGYEVEWSGQEVLLASAAMHPVREVTIDFITPTQLMADGNKLSQLQELDFVVLLRNILRRYSSLYVHHHDILPEESFAALLEKAGEVSYGGGEGQVDRWERYSMRREQRNPMEGFTGWLKYTGDLSPFVPYLMLGQWLHIGKWSVFGMGKYSCEFS
jgi:hypothetical protein